MPPLMLMLMLMRGAAGLWRHLQLLHPDVVTGIFWVSPVVFGITSVLGITGVSALEVELVGPSIRGSGWKTSSCGISLLSIDVTGLTCSGACR